MTDIDLILIAICLLCVDIAFLGFIVIEGFKKIQKEQIINKHDTQQIKVRIGTLKKIAKYFRKSAK